MKRESEGHIKHLLSKQKKSVDPAQLILIKLNRPI
jgi:hypothetical protein